MSLTYRISLKSLVVIFLSLFSLACISEQNPDRTSEKEMLQPKSSWVSVKVIFLESEGGFYGIVTNTGEKLLPMNLATEYKVVGTKLKIQGKKIEDMMTIQQWGTPFEIYQVELISKGENKNKANHQ
ncbi:MAG: hypothetical protein ACPGTQ_00470 [Colwellia sp.]